MSYVLISPVSMSQVLGPGPFSTYCEMWQALQIVADIAKRGKVMAKYGRNYEV